MRLIFFPCCVLFFAKHMYTLKHLNKPGDKLTQRPQGRCHQARQRGQLGCRALVRCTPKCSSPSRAS